MLLATTTSHWCYPMQVRQGGISESLKEHSDAHVVLYDYGVEKRRHTNTRTHGHTEA